MGHVPLDDNGVYAGIEDLSDEYLERRWNTPVLLGVKTPGDEATIMILASWGGVCEIGEMVQALLRPPTQEFMTPDSPWSNGECDPLGAVPYLTERLLEANDQQLSVWATTNMTLRGEVQTFHRLFPVVDFGAKLVRCFEIRGSAVVELTTWTFEEFADPDWRRRGHPLHTLDPQFVEENHLTFAPRWAEALTD